MTAQSAGFERPQPRTRPANRRQLITLAARELFFDRGYDSVSMGDIAGAVAIGPSALYRHFRGKQELLHEVLAQSMVPITERLRELSGPPEAWIPELVAVAAEHDTAALLWQREQVHLSEAQHAEVRNSVRSIGRLVAALVRKGRPELDEAASEFLAWAALAVVLSPAFYRSRNADDFGPDVIAELVAAVVSGPPPVRRAGAVQARGGLVPQSRREALLSQAIRLFGRFGYNNVGIEDIGSALGIAGPSVYNHFPTKADILVTALNRGWSYLQMDLDDVFATSVDEAAAVRGVLQSYVSMSVRHPELVGLLLTEGRHLPEEQQTALRLAQREYLTEWTMLVSRSMGEDPASHARTRVGATVRLVNDLVQVPHLSEAFDLEPSITALAARLLERGPGTGGR
jgi:AcrR family transcriptional regulator